MAGGVLGADEHQRPATVVVFWCPRRIFSTTSACGGHIVRCGEEFSLTASGRISNGTPLNSAQLPNSRWLVRPRRVDTEANCACHLRRFHLIKKFSGVAHRNAVTRTLNAQEFPGNKTDRMLKSLNTQRWRVKIDRSPLRGRLFERLAVDGSCSNGSANCQLGIGLPRTDFLKPARCSTISMAADANALPASGPHGQHPLNRAGHPAR